MAVGAVAVLVMASPAPVAAFGTYNSPTLLGQHAEHENITRVLARGAADGPGSTHVQAATLDRLAGVAGKLGAVGAPDNPTDSSWNPLSGLGPGDKHCDDADYLAVPGYPRTRDAADAEIRACVTYFRTLLDRAVEYAGRLVAPDLTLRRSEASLSCSFPYTPDSSQPAKCEVLNGLGRALHLAQDFWSHSNWGDVPAPGSISRTNPPGLGRTDVPAFLRYPVPASYEIPVALATGCDDSISGRRCAGRVGHSSLAKDNGLIDPASGRATKPTAKYPRSNIAGNFQAAVTGARLQTVSVWNDLRAAIIDRYGPVRGALIVESVRRDTLTDCAAAQITAAAPGADPSGADDTCLRGVTTRVDDRSFTTRWPEAQPQAARWAGPGGPTYQVTLSDHRGVIDPDSRRATTDRPVYSGTVPRPGTYVLRIQARGVGERVDPYLERFVVAPRVRVPQECRDRPDACAG